MIHVHTQSLLLTFEALLKVPIDFAKQTNKIFFLFLATLRHVDFQARDPMRATGITLCHSCCNTGSLIYCTTAGNPKIIFIIVYIESLTQLQREWDLFLERDK